MKEERWDPPNASKDDRQPARRPDKPPGGFLHLGHRIPARRDIRVIDAYGAGGSAM